MNITYSTQFTVGEIMSQFKNNQRLIESMGDKMTPNVNNHSYSPGQWLKNAIPYDSASEPVYAHQFSGRSYWLHHYFQIDKSRISSVEGDVLSQNKSNSRVMNVINVCNRWMSGVFGFFEHDGELIQLNPADLFIYHIYWDFPLDYALQNARVIRPDARYGDNWVKEVLTYYISSFLMLDGYNDLKHWIEKSQVMKPNDAGAMYGQPTEVSNVPVNALRESWLMRDIENRLYYLGDAKVSMSALLNNVMKLGEVACYGWSQSLACGYEDLKLYDGEYHEWVEWVQKNTGVTPYAKGYWSKKYRPPLKDKSKISFVSEEKMKVNKLLTKVFKDSNKVVKTELMEKVVALRIYQEEVTSRKSWFKDKFEVDAKSMDWNLQEKREWVVDSEGEESRKLVLVLTPPKTGRRSRK